MQAYREGRLDRPISASGMPRAAPVQGWQPGVPGKQTMKSLAGQVRVVREQVRPSKLSGCPMRKGGGDSRKDFRSVMELIAKEGNMNKIAITSEGPALDDLVDTRFGRAAGFIIVDLESMETRYIDNGQTQVMGQGAGIQAAQLIAGAGVSCILTGFVGPRAFQAFPPRK